MLLFQTLGSTHNNIFFFIIQSNEHFIHLLLKQQHILKLSFTLPYLLHFNSMHTLCENTLATRYAYFPYIYTYGNAWDSSATEHFAQNNKFAPINVWMLTAHISSAPMHP